MKKITTLTLFIILSSCNCIKESKELQNKKIISLENTTWIWQYTQQGSEKIEPKKKNAFTITFNQGNLSIHTDCNTMGGSYTINENNFELGILMSTKMYCPDSQESEFASMLSTSKIIQWNEKELQLISEKKGILHFEKK